MPRKMEITGQKDKADGGVSSKPKTLKELQADLRPHDGDILARKGKKYLCIEKDGELFVRRMGFSKVSSIWKDNSYRILRRKETSDGNKN